MSRTKLLLIAVVLAGSGRSASLGADAQKSSHLPANGSASAPSPRRVYILHSGLNTILSERGKNSAAERLKEGLSKRGIAERDLVVLDNPFPSASWTKLVPLESLAMFFDSIDPASKMSHDAYVRMHKALQAQGVSWRDNLVWVGHSAGGQMGLTMAQIAGSLWKYPDLAKAAKAYHFDMVITLGAPVGANELPADLKLRHYYSADDKVMRWASKIGPLVALPLGYRSRINKVPLGIGANGMIRWFRDIEHPYWDVQQRVLDRIIGETAADFQPAWHAELGLARWGFTLGEFMCRALEAECHVSVEDPPANK
jgi:hypothetical protein